MSLRLLLGLGAATFLLACERAPLADDVASPTAAAVARPDSALPIVVPTLSPAGRMIAGPTALDGRLGMTPRADTRLTLVGLADPHTVTLAPVIGSAGSTRWAAPSMDLFGSAAQPWRVQVGPRTDLGRRSGLMLRCGTEGQRTRWDLGASATVGEQSNVQGIVRFHP